MITYQSASMTTDGLITVRIRSPWQREPHELTLTTVQAQEIVDTWNKNYPPAQIGEFYINTDTEEISAWARNPDTLLTLEWQYCLPLVKDLENLLANQGPTP